MKSQLIVLALVLFSGLAAQAQEQAPAASPAPADFQALMKQMGSDFKILGTEARAGAFGADALPAAIDLHKTILLAQVTAPDSDVLDPNAADYAAKKADFDSLLKQEADLSQKLIDALTAGDSASALAALTEMGQIKKTGHQKYQPN